MFECIDDELVGGALFDVAAQWVREKGMKQLMGPVNLSFNHDCGVLIDCFDHAPTMMMAYNPPFYPRLFEANGLKKAKDLWSYELSTAVAPPKKGVRTAEKGRTPVGVQGRPIRMNRIQQDIRSISTVSNAILQLSWDFVPKTDPQ